MIEPNLWFDFGIWAPFAGVAGRSSGHSGRKQDHGDDDGGINLIHDKLFEDQQHEAQISLGELLKRWGHLSVTVTLAIFLFNLWQASVAEKNAMQDRILRAEEHITALQANNLEQHAALRLGVAAIEQRVGDAREDLRDFKAETYNHFLVDDRRFKAARVR